MDRNFEYLRDEDNNFFIVLGDNHREESISSLPLYAPDEEGGREYNDTALSKQPKDGTADLAGDDHPASPIRFGALEVDRERIEDVVSTHTDKEEIYTNLDKECKEAYNQITDIFDEENIMIIGSDTYDVGTDSSDLDLVYTGDYEQFVDNKPQLIAETDLTEVGEDWLEDRIERHSDRYAVPPDVAEYHHRHPQQRFWFDDLKVGFSPSHEPGSWEDYKRPEGESDPYKEVATVTDTEHNDSWPRKIEITDGDEDLDLVTYFWAYGGSFKEGDSIFITGERFDDTIYLREPGQYAAPQTIVDEARQ